MKIHKLSELLSIGDLPKTVSFDLFDTLIERTQLSVTVVHEAVSGYIISAAGLDEQTTPQKLTQIRYQTTNYLKQSLSANTEEPTLSQVWNSILQSRSLPSEKRLSIIDNAISLELTLEKDNLSLCSDTASTLEALKNKGHRLIAISDMYFLETEIREILNKLDILNYFDKVFVSSTSRATKQTGNLFKKAITHSEISQTIHIGDNPWSDVEIPRKLGIPAIHLKRPTPLTASECWKEHTTDIARSVAQQSQLFLFKAFAEAQRRKISTIYFAGRDAGSLLTIARSTNISPWITRFFPRISLAELGISRATTTWLSIDECLTAKDQAIQALIKCEQLMQKAYSYDHINKLLGTDIFKDETEVPSPHDPSDPRWNETVVDNINRAWKQKKLQTIRYLQQAKLIDDGEKMVIDVGYSGTSLRDINLYLVRRNNENSTNTNPTRLTLCMLAEGPNAARNKNLSSPYIDFSEQYAIWNRDLPPILRGNFSWLECFFKDTSRGPLVGYIESDKGLHPDYPQNSANEMSVKAFGGSNSADALHWLAFALSGRKHPSTAQMLRRFAHPDNDLLRQMDHFSSEPDAASGIFRPIVYENSKISLRQLIKDTNSLDYWMSGTLARNGYGWFIKIYGPTRSVHQQLKHTKNEIKSSIARQLRKLVKHTYTR